MLEPTRPLPTLPARRTHSTSDRKHDRQSRPARPPSGDRPSSGNGKPNICDGNFNTVAFFRREMFVFKVNCCFTMQLLIETQQKKHKCLHFKIDRNNLSHQRIAGSGACETTRFRKAIPCSLSSSGRVFLPALTLLTRDPTASLCSLKVRVFIYVGYAFMHFIQVYI